MYSFGILTYNQERDIIRALESVKFQVEQFSKGRPTELVVADDASADGTVALAKKWIEKNAGLFVRAEVLCPEQNQGTCQNIAQVYRWIEGEKLLCFAGDDAIAHNDIYAYLDEMDEVDIESACYGVFFEGTIQDQEKHYRSLMNRPYQKGSQMRYLSVARVPVDGPTMIFKKELIDDGLLNCICSYRLIEDRPTVYYLFKKHGDLKYRFKRRIHMLYQFSGGSVSHQRTGTTYSRATKDLIEFYDDCAKQDTSLILKYTARCNAERYKGKKIFKYLNFPYYSLMINDFLHKRESQKLLAEIRQELPACQKHLDYLNERAEAFLNS